MIAACTHSVLSSPARVVGGTLCCVRVAGFWDFSGLFVGGG